MSSVAKPTNSCQCAPQPLNMFNVRLYNGRKRLCSAKFNSIFISMQPFFSQLPFTEQTQGDNILALGTLRDKREASRVLYYSKCIYLIDCYIVDDKCWLWRQRSCNESLLLNYSTHVIQWRCLCVLLFYK